jgi:hypothetical protein
VQDQVDFALEFLCSNGQFGVEQFVDSLETRIIRIHIEAQYLEQTVFLHLLVLKKNGILLGYYPEKV